MYRQNICLTHRCGELGLSDRVLLNLLMHSVRTFKICDIIKDRLLSSKTGREVLFNHKMGGIAEESSIGFFDSQHLITILILVDLEIEYGQYDNRYQYRYVEEKEAKKIKISRMIEIIKDLPKREYVVGKGLPTGGVRT
jgi:hypothetical protein